MTRLALAGFLSASLGSLGLLNLHWASNAIDISPIRPRGASGAPSPIVSAPDTAFESGTDDLSQSLLRPIFHASRRPFVPRPPESEAEMMEELEPVEESEEAETFADDEMMPPPAGIALAGVNLAGERKSALLGADGDASMSWVSLGETYEGWTVTAVTKDGITMSDGLRTARINLYPIAIHEREVE